MYYYSMLQIRKLKPENPAELVQSGIASQWPSQNSNLDVLPEPEPLTTIVSQSISYPRVLVPEQTFETIESN